MPGFVYATLESGSGYTVDPTNYTAKVAVNDDEIQPSSQPIPNVNMIIEKRDIAEGKTAKWELRLNPPTTEELSFTFAITTAKGLSPHTSQTKEEIPITLPIGTTSYIFERETEDDIYTSRYSMVGTITNRISRFTISHGGTHVGVINNDFAPTMAISALDSTITEGEFAKFKIIRTGQTAELENVKINLSTTGDFIANADTRFVQFGKHDFKFLILPTIDDSLDESNGSITATLAVGQHYSLSEPNNPVTIQVLDNDNKPEISIEATTDYINEGSMANFQLFTPTTASSDITIGFTVSQGSGNYIDGPSPTSKILSANSTEALISIPTIDDDTTESETDITITLTSGSTYALNSEKKLSINKSLE